MFKNPAWARHPAPAAVAHATSYIQLYASEYTSSVDLANRYSLVVTGTQSLTVKLCGYTNAVNPELPSTKATYRAGMWKRRKQLNFCGSGIGITLKKEAGSGIKLGSD